MRQRGGRQLPVDYLHLVSELEFFQVLSRLEIQIRIVQAQEALEKIDLGEDRGEVLPVSFPVFFRDQLPVDTNLPFFRNVQACNEFCQSRLAAAVASDHKDQFSMLT